MVIIFVYKRKCLFSLPTLYYESANDGISIHSIAESVDYTYLNKPVRRERGRSLDLITFTKKNSGCKTTTGQNIRVVLYVHPTLRPVRSHKKRRIAKKYMKKYGFIAVHIEDTHQLVTQIGDTVYFTPDITTESKDYEGELMS